MKFISKSSNLLIVLRPGLSAQPITGTPAKPTISVRFKDGVVEVANQELIDMMLAHPGFNSDFISAESDPYAGSRQSSEPAHVLTDLKFGTPTSRTVGGKVPLTPELQRLVTATATEMAKQMVPELLKNLIEANEAGKKKVRGKPGPKPKNKIKASEPVNEVYTPETTSNPLIKD